MLGSSGASYFDDRTSFGDFLCRRCRALISSESEGLYFGGREAMIIVLMLVLFFVLGIR